MASHAGPMQPDAAPPTRRSRPGRRPPAGCGTDAVEIAMVDDRFDPAPDDRAGRHDRRPGSTRARNWHSVAAVRRLVRVRTDLAGRALRSSVRDAGRTVKYICKHHGMQGMTGDDHRRRSVGLAGRPEGREWGWVGSAPRSVPACAGQTAIGREQDGSRRETCVNLNGIQIKPIRGRSLRGTGPAESTVAAPCAPRRARDLTGLPPQLARRDRRRRPTRCDADAAARRSWARRPTAQLWKVQVGGMDMETATRHPGRSSRTRSLINAGDSIFCPVRADGHARRHTVTFTSGAEMPPLFMPDIVDGTPVASPEGPAAPDASIRRWPAGRPHRVRRHRDGQLRRRFLRMDQPAYMLTFTAPGTYEYVCAVHSVVMKAQGHGPGGGAALPNDAAAYDVDGPGSDDSV